MTTEREQVLIAAFELLPVVSHEHPRARQSVFDHGGLLSNRASMLQAIDRAFRGR